MPYRNASNKQLNNSTLVLGLVCCLVAFSIITAGIWLLYLKSIGEISISLSGYYFTTGTAGAVALFSGGVILLMGMTILFNSFSR